MSASAILSPTTSPLALPSGGSSGDASEPTDSFATILAGEVAETPSAPSVTPARVVVVPSDTGPTPEILPDAEEQAMPTSEPIVPNLWVQLAPLPATPSVETSQASSPATGGGDKALAQAAFTAVLMPTLVGTEATEETIAPTAPAAVEDSKAAAALSLEQLAGKRAASSPAEAALASLRALPGSGALQQATVTQRKSDAVLAGPTIATPDAETDPDPATSPLALRSLVPAEPLTPAAVSLSAAKGQAAGGPVAETAKPDIPATPASGGLALADAADSAPVVTVAAALAEAIVAPAEPLLATDADLAVTTTSTTSPTSGSAAVATETASLSSLSRATIETTANLAAQITHRLAGRSTRFELGLTPEGLGRVDVTLDIDSDGQLSARLAFDNPLAATELRGRADELRRQLEDSGFTLARDALDFSSRDQSSGRGHDQRQQRATAYADRHAQNDLIDTPAAWSLSPSNMTPRGVDVKV